jgi:hypothetical protein
MEAVNGIDNAVPVRWSLLSRHGVVLVYLALNASVTMRQLSLTLNLTERALYGIIKDLTALDLLRVERVGRTNTYQINPDAPLPNPLFAHMRLGHFLKLLTPAAPAEAGVA